MGHDQDQNSLKNSDFWNEICGTELARTLGIKDTSPQELARFDRAFFNHYPYLESYLEIPELGNRDVVEVGLGYGSVGELLARSARSYVGIDLAKGPRELMELRLKQNSLLGSAVEGDARKLPLPDSSADFLVAIGCFHHTGNFTQCLAETHRILRPGGRAVIMVYNQYSYRRWRRWPFTLLKNLFGKKRPVTEEERFAYDPDEKGRGAPVTEFFSRSEMRKLCRAFKRCELSTENMDSRLLGFGNRAILMATVGRFAGLDLYVKLEK